MSIKSDVQELESIKAEIKSMNIRRKILKTKQEAVEKRIKDYLTSKNQQGVKHQGTAIIIEQDEKRVSKKIKDRDEEARLVLEKYGINNASQVLEELLEARKGDKVSVDKLKVKKYKDKS
jgi:hypothetical protein